MNTKKHTFSGTDMQYLSLIVFTCLLLSSSPVVGTTYYVSNAGNDNNDGLSLSSAFGTLQHAADKVVAGDEVLVDDGTYIGFNIFTSGSEGAPILFKALGDGAIINQPNGFTRKDGINVEGSDWVIIDGFICQYLPRAGIR